MISDSKLKEIGEYLAKKGKEATKEAYSLNDETFNRYMRQYRKTFGEVDTLLGRLYEKFGSDGLEAMLYDEKPRSFIHTPELDFSGDTVKILVMSDLHIGSIYTDEDDIYKGIQFAIQEGCELFLCPGDLVEGMMMRWSQPYELSRLGYKAQRNATIDLLKTWGDRPFYAISGNHDSADTIKSGMGLAVVEDICNALPNGNYLGHDEGDIMIKGTKWRMFHGGDGASYALSYRIQKIIEMYESGHKPQVLLTGHDHKSLYVFLRNIHAIASGTMQKQSGFMRGKKLPAMRGFWIITATIRDGQISRFLPEWIPFYE